MESYMIAVLQHIHRAQRVTRRALCEQTGLSLGRVNALVSQLLRRGLLREAGVQEGVPGRPAALLSLNSDAGRVVGLDIGGHQSRAVLSDLSGRILTTLVRPTEAVPDPTVILDNLARLVEAVCQRAGIQAATLSALGVGVRAIVNTQTGVVQGWPSAPAWSPGWTGLDVPASLGHRLGVSPVVLDDAVRAMAMTAHRFGPARSYRNFLYVFLGTAIGAGVFVDGRPYLGSQGIAGELGHISISEDGPWCSCGNRGCLEVMASTSAVMRRVRERLTESQLMSALREPYARDELTLAALIEAACAGDKLAFQILDETGSYVGKVIALALNLLGPELVVLGGPLAQDGGIILAAVQRQVRLFALQHISRHLTIVCDDQGELAGARGAALLAIERLLSSPEHLARLLSMVQAVGQAPRSTADRRRRG